MFACKSIHIYLFKKTKKKKQAVHYLLLSSNPHSFLIFICLPFYLWLLMIYSVFLSVWICVSRSKFLLVCLSFSVSHFLSLSLSQFFSLYLSYSPSISFYLSLCPWYIFHLNWIFFFNSPSLPYLKSWVLSVKSNWNELKM